MEETKPKKKMVSLTTACEMLGIARQTFNRKYKSRITTYKATNLKDVLYEHDVIQGFVEEQRRKKENVLLPDEYEMVSNETAKL